MNITKKQHSRRDLLPIISIKEKNENASGEMVTQHLPQQTSINSLSISLTHLELLYASNVEPLNILDQFRAAGEIINHHSAPSQTFTHTKAVFPKLLLHGLALPHIQQGGQGKETLIGSSKINQDIPAITFEQGIVHESLAVTVIAVPHHLDQGEELSS